MLRSYIACKIKSTFFFGYKILYEERTWCLQLLDFLSLQLQIVQWFYPPIQQIFIMLPVCVRNGD